ncbi:FAD/NAD P-binding domain-containing protein [Pseudohyphozyma bogoriensis]|nr:FAD/NAD P-binding domain-containing protein [Pseudohyphozyma bogoriensis]
MIMTPGKRIGIVGGGTSGLGALIGLLDLPESVRRHWSIELLEKRPGVGGLWLADDKPCNPLTIPDSPAYPGLHVNTPNPTMTFPRLHYPPGTPLFASYAHVKKYHDTAVNHFGLVPFIKLGMEVVDAVWGQEQWTVTGRTGEGESFTRHYDHLVVANGHLTYPSLVEWEGQEKWLEAGNGAREVLHAAWYRDPMSYRGKTVVVVGFGASGWDMSRETVYTADKVYHSHEVNPKASIQYPTIPGTIHKPKISHFTSSSIVFADGTSLTTSPSDPISILLGTGYDLKVPFLRDLVECPFPSLFSDPTNAAPHALHTNGRYLRPLHYDTFSLDPKTPPEALSFVGLHSFISNAQASYVQGLYIGHVLAGGVVLPTREEMAGVLIGRETKMRERGIEPFKIGHKYPKAGEAEDYMDFLVSIVKSTSTISVPDFLADPDTPFVPAWRRKFALRTTAFFLRKGWKRAVEQGVQKQFTESASTEEEWVEALERLEQWENEQDLIEPRNITYQRPPVRVLSEASNRIL